ncbi:TST1 [Auxenochlorella protothecoides x Auxenochlorella symbiontica]
MGGDCCGGKPTPAVADQLADLSLDNLPKSNGSAASERPWAEIAKEKAVYFNKRVELFEKYREREVAAVEAARAAAVPVQITLPDGHVRDGVKDVTTPLDIAAALSKSLAKKAVVAEVDGKPWDLFRPLEQDCNLAIHTFDSPEGKDAFWHSSAHILGQSLELEFGAELTIGPALEEGFYYDCYLGDRTLCEPDRDTIQKRMQQIVKAKQAFERVTVSRAEALEMFQENKFKVELIQGLPEDASITCYRCGPMVDLCRGPHVPNTGALRAVAVTNASRAFWRADVTREPLQRVYAIAFPEDKELKEYQHRIEEAKKRDHRLLGAQQELFFFHQLSPGSCFFLPAGTRIYNALVEFIRQKYWKYGFEEVVTPNIYNMDLWKTSGHAAHYKENMFCFDIEKGEFGLKPMNCPGHCLAFGHRTRSYRELPLRLADFGVLHRNEFSGALQGLTRVRRFQQDDAHIFCRPDQVAAEIERALAFLADVYGQLGLSFSLVLSTRPEGFLGTPGQWDAAEGALRNALDASGHAWELNEGDGAFYGPKIDITVHDALRRKFQCATVQLDFQLPLRFGLQYVAEDGGFQVPVIIHRAVLGSVERMFAILTENFAGRWPLWLSPRQVMVVPISDSSYDYALEVRDAVRGAGFHVEVDLADRKMQKKVREAQVAQFNYILVVGAAEREQRTVNVRTRDNQVHGQRQLDDVLRVIGEEREARSLTSLFGEGPGQAQA